MRRADSIASTSRSKEISFSRTKPRRALMSMSTATPPLCSRRSVSVPCSSVVCGLAVELDLHARLGDLRRRRAGGRWACGPSRPGTSRSRPVVVDAMIRATSSPPLRRRAGTSPAGRRRGGSAGARSAGGRRRGRSTSRTYSPSPIASVSSSVSEIARLSSAQRVQLHALVGVHHDPQHPPLAGRRSPRSLRDPGPWR